MNPADKFRSEVEKLVPKGQERFLEKPPENIDSDLALPCFVLAKSKKKNPAEIAKGLAAKTKPKGLVKEVRATGPYLNFYADWKKLGQLTIQTILKEKGKYGSGKKQKETIMVEHTSANPDGPLHLGHFRNSVLGDSVCRILKFYGYNTRTISWVNDTGRQIAIAVKEYQKSRKKPDKKQDWWVLDLYIRGNRDMEKNPNAEDEIKKTIQAFESGDEKLAKDFHFLANECVKGHKETLSRIGINIDEFFMESKSLKDGSVRKILKKVQKLPQGKKSKERIFLDLKKFGIEREFTLTREDGTTIYPARDMAFHQYKFSKADKNINIIGTDQKFYFRQLKTALGLLFPSETKNYNVIFYEFLLLPEGTMSTRAGKFVSVDDLFERVIDAAKRTVHEKMPAYDNKLKESIARTVAVGAIKYAMIKVSPEKTYAFSVKDALKFEGDTAPCIQYSHARACSILRKGKIKAVPEFNISILQDSREKNLVNHLAQFPETVSHSVRDYRPHYIANYAHSLADIFNEFYQNLPVLKADKKTKKARLAMVMATKIVLKNALNLLGIDAPEKM